MRHLSEKDVSKILKISRVTLREWKKEDKIRFYQLGKHTSPCLYEPESVRAAIEIRADEIRAEAERKIVEIKKMADEMIDKDTD